jgi:alpha-tubulin suppressor-like RCC1 family protein
MSWNLRNLALMFAGLSLVVGGLLISRLPAAQPETPARTAGAAADKAAAGLQKIAPGEYHLFFLVDGKLLTIGGNRAGQMGIGHTGAAANVIPAPVAMPKDVRVSDVAPGGYHSLAVDHLGRVWTFGSNYFGQRGDGTPTGEPGTSVPRDSGTPQMIQTDSEGRAFDGVVRVDAGLWCDVALKKDGTVWVWGKNDGIGILGNGDTKTAVVNRPTRVPLPAAVKIVQIAAARWILMARDDKGGVWSWAGGEGSKFDRGTDSDDFSRPRQLPNLPPIKHICLGSQFGYALDNNGELWGWGTHPTYLGFDPQGNFQTKTPRKLSFPEFGGRKIATVAASACTTHAILEDGTLWGWGDSAMGMVGNGQTLDFSKHNYSWDYKPFQVLVRRPVQIAPQAANFAAVYTHALDFYVYAMTKDGRVFSWGRNKTGILGNAILPTGDAGKYPNSWDVPTATEVRPLDVKTPIPVPAKS